MSEIALNAVATRLGGDAARVRAVIDAVQPAVDGGRFPIKRVAGEPVQVTVHAFCDGHDVLRVLLRWGAEDVASLQEVEMQPRGNDEWTAEFIPPVPGRYRYTAVAWVDHFRSWRHELQRRVEPADIRIAAQVGARLAADAAARATGAERESLADWGTRLQRLAVDGDAGALKTLALDEPLAELMDRYADRRLSASHPLELPLVVERERARFSSWYECFPRSTSPEPGRHGTLRDVEARLPYIAGMGFDVLYFPPIHPIGRMQRKGRNNSLAAEPEDVGSPWAIGAFEGGHKDILPELGTLEDFRRLVAQARARGIEIAMDIAFQCAPDHPYVKAHPQWFRWRPDGSVQYAENPPKKYQDIYPFDFETEDWRALWRELKSVFEHWIHQGVTIFRVDNPHTKSFAFWEWCVTELKRVHPEVIFLSEAFTRPKVMHRLAKLGYSQSYTYFTWRHTKRELEDYFTELSQGPGREYFRPNVWPNTPDILNEQLHGGRRAMFVSRVVLAATLSASYGIYGPAYELLEGRPRSADSEEYLDSEKYQLRHWDLDDAASIAPLIARLNRIRRDHPALHADWSLRFLHTDNEELIAYVKRSIDGRDVVMSVVNLDPQNVQSGWVELDAKLLGVDAEQPFQVHDLLGDQRYTWQGGRAFVMLDPKQVPAHVLHVRRHARDERDFDTFR